MLGFFMFLLQNPHFLAFYSSFVVNRHIWVQNDQLDSIGFIYFS